MQITKIIADWANLPPNLQPTSLWVSVHDGDLQSIHSDVLARTLVLQFDVPYLRSFHGLADDVTFAFELEGVQSVRAMRSTVWPGDFPLPSHRDSDYEQKMTEYRNLWRQESESWATFESLINTNEGAELSDADVVSADGVATLRFGVLMESGEWFEVFARAEKVTLSRSDKVQITLSDFVALGNAYWEAFAKRRR